MGRGAHRSHSRHSLGHGRGRARMALLLIGMGWEREGRKAAGRCTAFWLAPLENAPGQLVPLGCAVSSFTPAAYRRHRL